MVAALERALIFRWFTATDIRSILDAGGVPQLTEEGEPVALDLPQAPSAI